MKNNSKLYWKNSSIKVGHFLDEAPPPYDAQINPDWVAAGPEADMRFLVNPEVLKKVCVGPYPTPWQEPKPAPIGRVSVEPSKPHSRVIFRKVYKGPGYPTDPRNERARALEGYVNAFAPQPSGVFDHRPLRDWLNGNIN